ncbi:pca operon transcription factor PcaQ [Amaricoccus solimangrovi]|uniref:Pca operon transcription factor PcaQ n=1 Tax=Amaricoccus solimangrovi TaxID=2589815 RepID=A0A501WPQ2_9RHOB|nr:pca operon transcription factor PcaQ [Amaricoccus solimangrovi]TPE49217.1 pca operon transcription factor PcaQ [Amaricoccus solimangrovi]
MREISYRHVRCFLEIARLQSVGQAAEALAVSQPAVSKTLRELEDRLGVKLFERAGRRLRLTAEGAVFQAHAGLSLLELQRGVRALSAGARIGQRIEVGVLPTVATDLMPRAALTFAERMPGVTLTITTGPNWLLLAQLRDGALDLVIGRLAAPAAMAGLVFEQLYVEAVVAVVRAGHPLTADPARALTGFPLIMPPAGAIIRPVVEQYFLSIGQEPPRGFAETVAQAVGRGLLTRSDAVWFISRGVVADDLAAGVLVELDLPGLPIPGPVGLTQRGGDAPAPLLAEVMRAIRDSVAR